MTQSQLDDHRQLEWLFSCLQKARMPLEDEKRLQVDIAERLERFGIVAEREVQLYAPASPTPQDVDAGQVVILKGTSMGKTTDAPGWCKPVGVIDFYVPSLKTGLEVKIKGNAGDVLRQLRRYAADPRLERIVLVNGKSFSVPEMIGPRRVMLETVNLARGWL